MEQSKNMRAFEAEDLEEELIEITPAANYEMSDAQDLPETGASHATYLSCSAACCVVVV